MQLSSFAICRYTDRLCFCKKVIAMPNRLTASFQRLQTGWMPYILLALLLGVIYAVLALRGFHLGFYGDVVAYQYHYAFDGVFGGMNWLITDHWERHLLGALFSAPLHIVVPDRYDLWYALALGLHISLGMVIFLLVDTLQDGQQRWLAFAIALFFVFDTFQTPSNIEFATGSHRKGSLILALLSVWAYIRFVRSQRQQLAWYILNLSTFILAIMIYEQSFFFFILHPLIALIEDRRSGKFGINRHDLWLTIRDSFLHVMIVLIYVYLLLTLFVGGNDNLQLTPAYVLRQIGDGLQFQLNPNQIIQRLSHALAVSQVWVVALLAIIGAIFFGSWIWSASDEPADTPWTPLWIIVFGLVLMLLNIFNASPTVWSFDTHARLIYASSMGTGMVIFGGCAWLVQVKRFVGSIVFAVIIAVFLSSGISFLYEHQAIYREQDEASTQVYNAIYEAIPQFAEDVAPYLLLVTDTQPINDLALHPQDFNFPRIFALKYGIEDFRADTVLYDIDTSLSEQRIQLTDAGIISPLRRDEVIAYDRVVIVAYDRVSNSAIILDQLPDDVLMQGNFDVTSDTLLETNHANLK